MSDIEYKVFYYGKKKTKKKSEIWYLNGKRHREDGPAYIQYYGNKQVQSEDWYLNGERHRKDGPAYIRYRQDGSLYCALWFLNGERLSEERIEQFKLEIEADKEIEKLLLGE